MRKRSDLAKMQLPDNNSNEITGERKPYYK